MRLEQRREKIKFPCYRLPNRELRRSGSTAITPRRQAEVPFDQPAISSSMRPQPMHQPVSSSIAQTFTQGLSIG